MKQFNTLQGPVMLSDADYALCEAAPYQYWDEINEDAAEHPAAREWLRFWCRRSYHRDEAEHDMI